MTTPQPLDVTQNRKAQKWSFSENVVRTLWALALPLFRFSPRPLWAWRRFLLRVFGARIGSGVHVYPTVRVTIPWNLKLGAQCAVGDNVILYALGPIALGARATISQGAHLCAGTHDIHDLTRPLVKLPINVGADAWVAAEAFIGPGVNVGNGSVVGARAVAMKDIPANVIVVGNPAKVLRRINQ